MRGLAFPPSVDIDRETSYEHGTPISNVADIPIDPALETTVIDPVLMLDAGGTNGVQHPQPELPFSEHISTPIDHFQLRQFLEVPEGDPFAQRTAPYIPVIQESPLPPPKPKRKRKIRREETCSFCRGDESKNKLGQSEILLTCHECGRSGHPSCMQLTRVSDVVLTYPWKCIECKICELCQEKGDDDRILFCDWCDRGWHLDCMDPSLDEPPDGEWHCPLCPPLIPGEIQMTNGQGFQESCHPLDIGINGPIGYIGEASLMSPSRSPVELQSTSSRRKKVIPRLKGRRPATMFVVSEPDEDVDIEADDTPVAVSKVKGRPRKSVIRRTTQPSPSSDEDDVAITPVRARRRRSTHIPTTPPPSTSFRVRLRIPGKGKGKEREDDEPPHGLFDDILGPEERDTSKTFVTNADKLYFERSRVTAEEKLTPTAASTSTRTLDTLGDLSDRPRPLRSAVHQLTPLPKLEIDNPSSPSTPGGSSLPLKFEPGVLRIRSIRFGPYDIKTWYDAPFPEEYAAIPDGRLWICEFCLKYMKSPFAATRHQMKCKIRNPPGDEIYRDGAISIFEVDGRRNKIYCQNLCLLSKMFLDHKSLFYDVEPFLFYVIAQVDEYGARFVGYFSKEKRCPKEYNLSCIMTLPVRQRQGWGNMLIDFSYLLSKIEQRLGSPEKPLSSLGALGYRNYWTLAVMRFLSTAPDHVRMEDICSATSMIVEDVYKTLIEQNMIYIQEPITSPIRPSPGQSIKFPRGRKNGLARRQLQKLQTQEKEITETNDVAFKLPKQYEIHFDRVKVGEYLRNWERKGYVRLKPDKLQWMPYITTRGPQESNAPVLPAMDTILDDSSKATSTEPTTPAPQVDCTMESLVVDVREQEEEVDTLPAVMARSTRTRTLDLNEKGVEMDRLSRTGSASPSPAALIAKNGIAEADAMIRTTRRVLTSRASSQGETDEAYAVKLAMEEENQQGRLLRSRHSGSVRLSIGKARKRRRVESSPEIEEVIKREEVMGIIDLEDCHDEDAEGEYEEEI